MTDRNHVVRTWEKCKRNTAAAARELGLARSTVHYHLTRAGAFNQDAPVVDGRVKPFKTTSLGLPEKGCKRFILTCAQNNTHINGPVWDALQLMAEHYGAEILCASYNYKVSAYGKFAAKRGREKRLDHLWYDPAITPLLDHSDRSLEIAPGLIWCGEMNTLPTTRRPLSGFETYTGRKSGIFPHAKIAMQSVASARAEASKLNFTTGTITMRNYIQKRAGLLAEHHHCYGGLIVEVDARGRWFVRQLNSTEDGTVQDLDVVVKDGKITTGNPVHAITWGDVHTAQLDADVARLAWGRRGMLDTLKPRYQFIHDLLDFYARNHWDRGNCHRMFKRFCLGSDSVEREVQQAADFLNDIVRPWCDTIVVDSNHDNALERWLRETDYRSDPGNALFFLEAQLKKYRSIEARNSHFHLLEWACQRAGCPGVVRFLREDESFVICQDAKGGIECGMHGHLGPSGTRGTPEKLSKMGRKANTAHTHAAQIVDGMYVAGCSERLDVEYARGPGAWTHSHILTYPSGKRAIVTMYGGKWRA